MRSLHGGSNGGAADNSNQDTNAQEEQRCIDDECSDLLNKCLILEPGERVSAELACEHPCFRRTRCPSSSQRSASSDDALISTYLESVPNGILLQQEFLRSLELNR